MTLISDVRAGVGMSVLLLALAGCASLDPDAAFQDVAQRVAARSGHVSLWQRDDAARAEAARLAADLLRAPLRADDAARLALLQSPAVQAAYAELGEAEARAVQGALLRNPFLHANVQSPRDGDADAIDLSLSWDVLGLFTLPLRQEAAAHERGLARMDAARRALEAAARARSAWYAHQAAREKAELLADVLEAETLQAEIARRLSDAGNLAGLTWADAQARRFDAEYAFEDARSLAESTRLSLHRALGLEADAPLTLHGGLPRLPERDPALPDIDTHLEVARLQAELARAEKRVAVARATAWSDSLEVGWYWSRDDGEWKDGPGVGVSLPLFDTGAARRAAEGFAAERLRAELAERRAALRQEALASQQRMRRARQRVEHVREHLLPLLREAGDAALLEYNAMQRSAAGLLAVKQRESQALRQLVQGLDDYWQARVALESLALGVSLETAPAPRLSDPQPQALQGGH